MWCGCNKSSTYISITRGPWTATPALIKIDGKGQINYLKLNVTTINEIFREIHVAKHNQQFFFLLESSRKAAFRTENFN